eukprot:scaffold136328_cov163-Phaeocystis_antarctica.AAC.1
MRALEQGFHGKDFVIGCHAAEISDSGGLLFRAFKGVHTEINLYPGRHERFAELPKSLGARRSDIFTEDEPSPHQAELRGGFVWAGVYPLNRAFATESPTIADWDQSL